MEWFHLIIHRGSKMVFTDYLLTVYTHDGRTIYSTFETEDESRAAVDTYIKSESGYFGYLCKAQRSKAYWGIGVPEYDSVKCLHVF